MRKSAFLLILFTSFIFAGCRTVVYRDVPPAPAPKAEIYGTPPYVGAIWVPGHWRWHGARRGYVWIPGHWK
ncbi:MAG: hypothetical protein NC914_03790 [Candidatus Omnitrophica bacterium]|nr:hypothetical protein [Candidatus Omnitrophota bacterium]